MAITNQETVRAELGKSGALYPLTPREKDILHLLGKGLANKLIAYELGLTLNTVKEYNFQIFKKIGVNNRSLAGFWARDHNL